MPERRHAVVIGASIAGLLIAKVLSGHYKQVTIIEKDSLPETPENRKGVPQDRHTHVLLERGRKVMEKYLPGLTDELIGMGAVRINDVSSEAAWFHSGGFHKRGICGLTGLGVSRPTLENSVRTRIFSIPNVEVIQNSSVTGLAFTENNKRVNGVYCKNISDNKPDVMIQSDFVADVSGRGSHTPSWLSQAGYDRPEIEEIIIRMGYVTCYYPRKPEHLPGINAVIFLADPPSKRMGIMLAQEVNRWVVTIGGYLGNHAPTDYQGFLEAVKHLPSPDIYNIVKDEVYLTQPVRYNFHANLRHYYERLNDFPEGFVVAGDAVCSFNPIYGQGMTVAAMEAEALDRCLYLNHLPFAENFFKDMGKIVDISWKTAVGGDLNYPEIKGDRTIMTRLLNWYIRKLHKAARYDADVSIAFLKVINMVSSPPAILTPRIVWRIMKNNIKY